jgi:rRNA maturation endonuclease Nob1
MFNAVKEIIWHLTCTNCKGWFTFATMEENYCIDRTTFHCPHCGNKARCQPKEVDNDK